MAIVQKVPRDLEEALGPKATDGLIDLLNTSFNSQKEDIVQLFTDKFEKVVTQDSSRLELKFEKRFNELDNKIIDFKGSFEMQISEMGKEVTKSLSKEITSMNKEISSVKEEISSMNKDITQVKIEISGINKEILNAGRESLNLSKEIASVRSELKSEFKSDLAKVHESISKVHESIASQTKWLLVLGITVATMYPVMNRIVAKIIP
ncbi:MAG: hypothetical protein K8R21_11645 [Leptospira sp.]|nr:hypothetical protein [Leptospira sp.]